MRRLNDSLAGFGGFVLAVGPYADGGRENAMTTLSDRSQAVARLYQAVISRAVIGTAVDTNGDPVPNPAVELRRSDTGDRRTVTTPDTSSDSSPSINFPPAINAQLPTANLLSSRSV